MEPIVIGCLGVAVIFVLAAAGIAWERNYREWTGVAEELGLTFAEDRPDRCLLGEIDGFRVRIERQECKADDDPPGAVIVSVSGLPPIADDLVIATQDKAGAAELSAGSGRVAIGDPAFDRILNVWGDPILALAALDRPARLALLEAAHRYACRVEAGRVYAIVNISLPTKEELVACVHTMVNVARSLGPADGDVLCALLRNASDDPLRDVRLANLTAALQRFPEAPASAAAAKAALADADPDFQLAGATASGGDGIPVLSDLAHFAGQPRIRAEAVRTLTRVAHNGVVSRALVGALDDSSPLVLQVALQETSRLRLPEAVPPLLALLERIDRAPAAVVADELRRKELTVAALRTLGAFRDRGAELRLIDYLDRDDPEIRTAALDALADCGSGRAFARLSRHLGRGANETASAPEQTRVHRAVERIAQRLGGADLPAPHGFLADLFPGAELRDLSPITPSTSC